MTYTLIARTELTSTQANITISSIPATFTDLLLVVSGRSTTADTALDSLISFNGSTSNFSFRQIYGFGTIVASLTTPARQIGGYPGGNSTVNTFSNSQIYISNYRASTAKSYSIDSTSENNEVISYNMLGAGLWNDTAAINSIVITSGAGGSLAQFSSATLYGITSGSSGGVVVS
jgi:hypothetical protein